MNYLASRVHLSLPPRLAFSMTLISHNVFIEHFRKSTTPQNRQLIVLNYDSKQQVDDFWGGEVTF